MFDIQCKFKQMLKLKYYNPLYKIAFDNWKEMYLLEKEPTMLLLEVYQGKLVYREQGTSKRIAYNAIKKGLLKKEVFINLNLPF